ncbi:hypothetical protein Tco_1496818 [Tanacetum coccineum]
MEVEEDVLIKTTQKRQRLLKFQRDLVVVVDEVEDEVEDETSPEPRTASCDLYEFGRIWIPTFGYEEFLLYQLLADL